MNILKAIFKTLLILGFIGMVLVVGGFALLFML
jgi:hypothetical protein